MSNQPRGNNYMKSNEGKMYLSSPQFTVDLTQQVRVTMFCNVG